MFARTQAELLPAAASVTERPVANKTTEREPQTREQLLAISQQLVRVIKGKRRCGMALI
ncbi:Phage head completion protein (GPL) [compost metagenome]